MDEKLRRLRGLECSSHSQVAATDAALRSRQPGRPPPIEVGRWSVERDQNLIKKTQEHMDFVDVIY